MKRLLIVDDDRSTRTALQKTLEKAGYLVTLASDSAEALQRMAAGGIDLVLTDYQMPGLDGIGLARELASRFPARAPAVILMTGHGDVEHYIEAMSVGVVQEYLNKPVARDELLLIIDSVLHGHSRRERHAP